MSEPGECYLGLGANLGQRARQLAAALAMLAEQPTVTLRRVSPVYESAAEGGAAQPDYLNLAALVKVEGSPEHLLELCAAVETASGRQRPYPRAPRTLDIDLLLWPGERRQSEQLTLPHPRLLQRPFVVVPLADIAPRLQVAGSAPMGEIAPKMRPQVIAVGTLSEAVRQGR